MALRFRGLDAPIEVQYWKGGKAPVPDPVTSINAQANANRYNIVGPSGSQTWSKDPSGQATQTVSLNPSEQKQYDLRNQIAETMLGGSQGQIKDLTDTPFSYDTSGFDSTPFSFDQATPAAAKASYDRQAALLKPDFDNADREFEQRMANAGVPLGSEAYNDALRQHENDKNFALTDAARAADTIGSQLALSERQQRTSEAGSKADRSLSQRQQRVNEIARVLGEGDVAPVGAYGQAGSPIDVSGAYDAQNEANLANYNAKVSGNNALLGTIGQIGAAGLGAYSNYKSNQRTAQRPSAAGGEAATQNLIPSYSGSTSSVTDTPGGTTTYFGSPDEQLDYVTPTVSRIGVPEQGSGSLLGSIGKGVGAGMDAYGVYSGLKEGGVKGYGSALAGASNLAGLAGAGGTGTTALGTIGNAASGNYVGAAKGLYSLAGGGTSGGAAAGGAAAGSSAATSGAAAGGASALGTVATGLGYAGLALAAGQGIHNWVNGAGDEKRNMAAYTQAFGAQPVSYKFGHGAATFYQLGDGRLLSTDDFQKLSGAWYGATYAPDSDRAGWQKKYDDLNSSLKSYSVPKNWVKL